MIKGKNFVAATIAATLIFSVGSVHATPIVSISGGTNLTNGSWSIGFSFIANQAITVTQLGFYDEGGNGLTQSHAVGLYDASGALLTSGTVVDSDPLQNLFRYTDVSNVSLTIGDTYFLVAVTGSEDYNRAGTITVDPAITFLQDAYYTTKTSVLTMPDNSDGFSNAYFGPNLQYGNAAVPEPSTLALLGIGMVGVPLMRRQKVRKSLR